MNGLLINNDGLDNKREYGIDCLRIISMLMVIILHINNHGGAIESCDISSTSMLNSQYCVIWLLEILSLCGVNVYAIISGYVSQIGEFNNRKHYCNLIALWFRVVFYSFLITIIFSIYTDISLVEFIKCLLPVTTTRYWYFTMYFALAVFVPFLNIFISVLSKRNYLRMMTAILILFCFLPTIREVDIFHINYGYSVTWLMILYILGAGIKKYELFNTRHRYCIVGFIVSLLGTYLLKIGVEIALLQTKQEYHCFTLPIYYTTPLLVVQSVCLLGIFIKIRINNCLKKFISVLSVSSFSVYLLHDNNLVRDNIFNNSFTFLTKLNPFFIVIIEFLFAVLIFTLCICIDRVRILIERKLRIREYIEKAYDSIIAIMDRKCL